MRAFVFTGGTIRPEMILERPKEEDLVIAADCGYENARSLGVKVSILMGDFDSFPEGLQLEKLPEDIEIIEVPAEKDATDTQLAVGLAIERGADDIVIIGGLSGRIDHTMSNLSLLEDIAESRIHALYTDGQNRVRFIRSTSHLVARSEYRYLSLIAVDETVKGVTVEGCKYPLKNAKLSRGFQYAVSNEITGNCALITVKKGGVFVIESRD